MTRWLESLDRRESGADGTDPLKTDPQFGKREEADRERRASRQAESAGCAKTQRAANIQQHKDHHKAADGTAQVFLGH